MIADHGVSRVTTKLADRFGGRRLLDKVRAGDQVIVRWINRLGRNYDDATVTILHLMNEGVVVKTVINAMVFEGSTTDPIQKAVRDAMIAFMATTAQAQAEKAKFQQGAKSTLWARCSTISAVAKATNLTRQAVYRIEQDPAAAEAMVAKWNS